MFIHLQMLLLGLLLLLVNEAITTEAVTTFVASQYSGSNVVAFKTSVSTYTVGLTMALQQSTSSSVVSYTWSVVPAAPIVASSVYSSFSVKESYLAMFGPAGRLVVASAIQDTDSSTFVCFAPFTQSQTQLNIGMLNIPRYRDPVYFTLPSSQAQAVGIFFFLSLRDLFPIKQYSIRTSSQYVAATVQSIFVETQSVLGVSIATNMYGTGTVNDVSTGKIRVLYVNTETDTNGEASLTELLTSSVLITLNTTLCTSTELALLALTVYQSQSATKSVIPHGNIIISMPVPGIDATEYTASQNFESQWSSQFGSMTTLEKDLLMSGWTSGLALMMAMNMYTGTTLNSKIDFFNNLLSSQSSFLVDDLFIGSFGSKACSTSSMAWAQGAVCDCHTGGNNVWFHSFTKKGNTYDTVPLRGGLYQYGLGMCANVRSATESTYTSPNTSSEVLPLPRTVHLVGMSLSDDAMTSSICSQTYNTIARVADTSLFWHHSSHALRGYCLSSTMTAAPSDYSSHIDTYVTTSMMGVIPTALLASGSPPTAMILDFIPQTTQPRLSVTNYIYVFPTLDQELAVLMSYISSMTTASSVVCGVVRSSTTSGNSLLLIKKTMKSFGFDTTNVQQQPTGSLGSNIAPCTHTFVVDATKGDVADLAKYLKEHPTSILLVPFDDMTKQYASFLTAFGSLPETVTKRLVFATNLPTWTGTTMSATELGKAKALSTVGEYVRTLASIDQTPAAARAFVVAMLYDKLTRGTTWGQHDLQEALYGNVTLTISGMTIGPFTKKWSGAENKLINYGATDIAVWSFTRVLAPGTAPLAPPATPALVYDNSVAGALVEAIESEALNDVNPNSEEGCIPMQASSSMSRNVDFSNAQPTSSLVDSSASEARVSSSPVSSSSNSDALKNVAKILVVLLVLVMVYNLVLLLVLCGAVAYLWGLVASTCCCVRCFKTTRTEAANKFRRKANAEWRKDVVLQHASCNSACAPEDSTVPPTFVVVEVDSWRPLWVREAEVMSRAMRHYQRCVRQVVVRHQCYEMISIEGVFVLVCATVDAGVNVACDVVRDVASLPTRDASAVSAAYDHCGCGATLVPGLRLRVAVHSGVASRRVDPIGRVLWSGGAVELAVRAACAAGEAGMVVITATAKNMLSEGIDLPLRGHVDRTILEQLYVMSVLGGIIPRDAPDKPHWRRGNANAGAVLFFVATASGPAYSLSSALCKEQLKRHFMDIPEGNCFTDLYWMCHRFCLPEVSTTEKANEHTRYYALLNSVSRHLGSILECRHGVLREAIQIRTRGILRREGDATAFQKPGRQGSGSVSYASRKARKTTQLRTRRIFFYSKNPDEE